MNLNVGYIVKQNTETMQDALKRHGVKFEHENLNTTLKKAFSDLSFYRAVEVDAKIYKVKIIVTEIKRRKNER